MPSERMPQIEQLMSQAEPVDPPLPVPRYLGLLMARVKFWETNKDAKPGEHPGINVFKAFIEPHSPELLKLTAELISEAHTKALFPNATPTAQLKALVEEATLLDQELDITLTSVLADGVEDEHDKALAIAKARGSADSTDWTLAQALKDKAALAKELAPKLAQLGDFDEDLPGKADVIGSKLAELAEANNRASASIAKRNTLIAVAEKTLDQLERAARYAFRNAPAMLDAMPTRAQFARR
jgi:chromosome segregation ATPase